MDQKPNVIAEHILAKISLGQTLILYLDSLSTGKYIRS